MTTAIRSFSLQRYIESALAIAEYERDEESGFIIAIVPGDTGFFTQGETFEEARENLRDAIEGNVLLALQLGYPIPDVPGVQIQVGELYAAA